MTPVAAMRAMQDATPSLRDIVGPWLRHNRRPEAAEHEALVVLFDSSQWTGFRSEASRVLPSQERERSLRFRQEQHRDAYVMAHAVWRLVLGDVLGMAPEDVALASTAHGQPCLPGTGYATSLSHSGNHVAIAVARAECIGIDVEQAPPRTGMRDLLKVVCTPEEADTIGAFAAHEQDAALLALWTRKEALLKAFGVGLLATPSTIRADAGMPIAPPALAADMPACIVHSLTLPKGWVGALAAPGHISELRVHWLPMHTTAVHTDGSEHWPVL
ncbi:4'-phosphopantetheinyl transferase family protein [Dyella amyloliquefaciens]|uniref:4'-phosphopantetheinyl transferase family protein n=1 Tax=Dyella amyloliquefaciens TaxID=1770545 RepID=UPI00102EAE35|nr:4'-phosphopantetheinyl transferase superfamily protein [Dyella amyloliquefaciens]